MLNNIFFQNTRFYKFFALNVLIIRKAVPHRRVLTMKIKCRCFKCKSTQDQDPIHRSDDLSVTHNRHIGVWDLEEMNYIKSKIMQLFLLFFSSFFWGGESQKRKKKCQISFSLVLTTICKQCRICLAGDVNWMSARETPQHCERFRKDDRLITTLLRAYVYTDF